MCMEAIAARAGISKTTLYRRYKSKEAVVVATLIAPVGPPPTDLASMPDSTRDALAFIGHQTASALNQPAWLPFLGAAFSEGPHEGGLASVLRREVFEPIGALIAQVVQRGIERGELRPSVSPELTGDLVHGSLFVRSMMGVQITDAWVASVMDAVWDGVGVAKSGPALSSVGSGSQVGWRR
jgi:AcrR family transcriptional regulator